MGKALPHSPKHLGVHIHILPKNRTCGRLDTFSGALGVPLDPKTPPTVLLEGGGLGL